MGGSIHTFRIDLQMPWYSGREVGEEDMIFAGMHDVPQVPEHRFVGEVFKVGRFIIPRAIIIAYAAKKTKTYELTDQNIYQCIRSGIIET